MPVSSSTRGFLLAVALGVMTCSCQKTDEPSHDPETLSEKEQLPEQGESSPTPEPIEEPPEPPLDVVITDEQQQAAPETRPTLPWLDWVVSHCLIDELGPSEYAIEWMKWIHKERRAFSSFMNDDAPRPNLGPDPLPAPGSPEASRKAQLLREKWLATPASHVVECKMHIERRDCPGCKPVHMKWGSTEDQYDAYLPKELFTDPSKVRSLLLLAPGGNGGRTRYFLTPIPNKSVTQDKRSGGLEVKRHTDEYFADHPDRTPAIVIATENGGWSKANGHIEYLSNDLPKHVADTYLGGIDHHRLALGVEGISRGSRAIIIALRLKPEAFHTVGLTCLHCGRYGGPRGGYEPERDLQNPDERKQWLDTLADRTRRKLFHIRFSVGNADPQWTCNKRLHDYLVEGGVVEDRPPQFSNCRSDREDPTTCDTVWDGFYLYDRMPHHYGLLKPSWVPQLRWHLDTLHAVSQTMERELASVQNAKNPISAAP